MDPHEILEVRRRITVVLDVAPSAPDDSGLAAASAARTFNAESAEYQRLLTTADYDVRAFGMVRNDVAHALRQAAALRDARRRELLAEYGPLLA